MVKYTLMFCAFAALFSCTSENAEEKYNPSTCNTDSVTYSVDVSAIMTSNCTGCHGGANPVAGLDLTTYENVMQSAAGIRDRINKPAGAAGVMPPSGPMAQCDIEQVNAWIDAGAPNN